MKYSKWLLAGALFMLPAQMMAKGHRGAQMEADKAAVFAQADADGSGALSPDELKTFKSLMRAKREEHVFSKLDANGDGAVSLDELKAAHGGRHHGPHCDK